MESYNPGWLVLVGVLVTLSLPYSQAFWGNENKIKTAVYLSPKFVLGPGSVGNVYFYNVEFPRGHIALKSFNGEVVDEAGKPVPLHETYIHHWAIVRYYAGKGGSDYISGRNSGICQDEVLGQFFGSGSETRKTATHVPDPYGIEVEDEHGKALRPSYKGGLSCCYDGTQCRLKPGFEGIRRTLYLRYIVEWVDMDSSVLPVKVYIFDVTDTWKRSSDSTGTNAEHDCKTEYDVESCGASGLDDDDGGGCVDSKRISLDMPFSGYVIYGVAHQHTGASGSALYREDGQLLCSSLPIYGEGEEAGNEDGYVVGMSTCYPQPGAVKISEGETLILESNYSSISHHTGLMGIFHIFVAEQLPNPMHTLNTFVEVSFPSLI
ncbi:hypothetical protein PTKIN_Ptkin04bG0017100 [Pterospermum kingtungense]